MQIKLNEIRPRDDVTNPAWIVTAYSIPGRSAFK